MSFMEHPQSDACRALMPSPEPPPPGPPSRPMVCHMPKGHDGPHAITRHPRTLDRRWEGDARPPVTPPTPVTAVDVDALDKLREAWAVGGWPAADAMFAVQRALPDLLAEVRRGRALREAVEGLAEELDASATEASRRRTPASRAIALADASAAARIRAALATGDGAR